jgi:hypothetical protein
MPRRRGSKGGRSCWLTVALDLVHLVSQGEPLEDAARMAGIGTTTLWRWLVAGRAGDPRFTTLVEAINRAGRGSEFARLMRCNELDLCRLLSRN